MANSVFVFSRFIEDDDDHQFAQTVAIFAADEEAAREVLDSDLEAKRETTTATEPALQAEPGWMVHEVELNRPKVVTFLVT